MHPAPSVEKVARWLADADRIVTFSGAGLSRASGIPTYRDAGGLWTQGDNLKFSSGDALAAVPAGFLDFWAARWAQLSQAEPNAGHRALAELERRHAGVQHITQNVDGLLQRAGCTVVRELHGSLARYRCDACGARDFAPQPRCPACGQVARPDVVMFGEMLDLPTLEASEEAALKSDLCLVVGTSAVVHPAADIVAAARARGVVIVVVNVDASALDPIADAVLRGPAEQVLPALLAALPR